jgi:hypothetical protein
VHAGNGGVRVVQRADEAAVEVDVAAGDGVEDADAGQPRRCGRIDEEADEGESAREQQWVRTNGNPSGRRRWSQSSTPAVTAR